MINKQPTTLYIIGNGFDIHHKLDTWYSSFGLFLRDKDSDIYEYFLNYFGFVELDEDDEESLQDPLWSHFEESLSMLDIDQIIDDHSEYAAQPHSDNHSDKDWDNIEVYVSQIRDDLTIKMLNLFKKFILNVEYPDESRLNILNIDKNASFFNFNYSKSLELYYQIQRKQILYIHNRAESSDKLILGHGMNPKEFERKDEEPPIGLDNEGLQDWYQQKEDFYDFSAEKGRDALIKYFANSFKETSKLIEKNKGFFKSLKSINKVFVLGHSLADVDKEYFEKIIKSISIKTVWIVSYHNPNERKARKSRLNELGIKNRQIVLVQMDDLTPKFWNKVKLYLRIAFAKTRCILNI